MNPVYCALVHHPVRDRDGQTATAAVTNIDVHDIARSAHTFGLCGMFVVSPIDAQRSLVMRILEHWQIGAGKRRMPHRSEALAICQPASSIAEALATINAREGRAPRVIATAARSSEGPAITRFADLRQQLSAADSQQPWLLLFGTGHGLADEVLNSAHILLEPIQGRGDYNHLSVRAAAAIVFDRLFGAA
jgi:hypothetical protein